MKRLIQISAVIFSILFIAGVAAAASITYTYNDNVTNWPGYYIDPADEIGTPTMSSLSVTINAETRVIQSISINTALYKDWDGLYINTNWTGGESYDKWNLYAYSYNSATSALGFKIGATYQYAYAGYGRTGHPDGIVVDSSMLYAFIDSITYDGTTLIYYFDQEANAVTLGDQFVIGYHVGGVCANDVFLTPVPEPATMLLLGLGLVGAAAIRRRMK